MRDAIQQWVQALAYQDALTRVLAVICAAALLYVLCGAWLLVAVRRAARITPAAAARIAVLAALAYLLSRLLAHVIVDPRPYLVEHLRPLMPVARDNGFPSDHVLLAAALTAGLCWIDRRWVLPFALGTLLVMLGRLGVAAHHTLDVVGSAAIVAVAVLAARALPLPARWNSPLVAAMQSAGRGAQAARRR